MHRADIKYKGIIVAGLLFGILTAGLILLGFAFEIIKQMNGSEFQRHEAEKAIRLYAKETWPELDLIVGEVKYDYKRKSFYGEVGSKTSIDTRFHVYLDEKNRVMNDDYILVTTGRSTMNRLMKSYSDRIAGLDFSDAKYKPTSLSGRFYDELQMGRVPFILNSAELERDKDYDVGILGKKYGEAELNYRMPEVSEEILSEVFLESKRRFDKEGIGFYSMNVVIWSDDKEKEYAPPFRMSLLDKEMEGDIRGIIKDALRSNGIR